MSIVLKAAQMLYEKMMIKFAQYSRHYIGMCVFFTSGEDNNNNNFFKIIYTSLYTDLCCRQH